MKIFIAGGSGTIGRQLVAMLVQQGPHVRPGGRLDACQEEP